MATVVEELLIKITGIDAFSGPLSTILQNLQNLTALAGTAANGVAGLASANGGAAESFTALSEAGAGVVSFLHEATTVAAGFEDGMATIQGITGATAEQIEGLGNRIEDLGNKLRRPTEQLLDAAVNASKLGIAFEDLGQFTEIIDKFAISTGMGSEEAAQGLSKLRKIFQMTGADGMEQLQHLTNAIVDVDTHSGMMAQDMVSAMTRVTAAQEMGLSPQHILAFIATLGEMGMAPSKAGTEFNSGLTMMVQQAGGHLAAAAKLAHMTAAEFKQALDTDANAVFTKMLNNFSKIESRTERLQTATEVWGRTGAKAWEAYGQRMSRVTELSNIADEAFSRNDAMQQRLNAALSTTNASWEILKNHVYAISQTLGAMFLPAIKGVLDAFSMLLGGVLDLMRAIGPFNTLLLGIAASSAAVYVAFGAGGLAAFFSGMGSGLSMLLGWLPRLLSIIGTLVVSVTTLGGALRIFQVLLAGSGIGLIVLAVAGLVEHFGGLNKIVSDFTKYLSEAATNFGNFVSRLVRVMGPEIKDVKEVLQGLAYAVVATFVDIFTKVGAFIERTIQLGAKGLLQFDSFTGYLSKAQRQGVRELVAEIDKNLADSGKAAREWGNAAADGIGKAFDRITARIEGMGAESRKQAEQMSKDAAALTEMYKKLAQAIPKPDIAKGIGAPMPGVGGAVQGRAQNEAINRAMELQQKLEAVGMKTAEAAKLATEQLTERMAALARQQSVTAEGAVGYALKLDTLSAAQRVFANVSGQLDQKLGDTGGAYARMVLEVAQLDQQYAGMTNRILGLQMAIKNGTATKAEIDENTALMDQARALHTVIESKNTLAFNFAKQEGISARSAKLITDEANSLVNLSRNAGSAGAAATKLGKDTADAHAKIQAGWEKTKLATQTATERMKIQMQTMVEITKANIGLMEKEFEGLTKSIETYSKDTETFAHQLESGFAEQSRSGRSLSFEQEHILAAELQSNQDKRELVAQQLKLVQQQAQYLEMLRNGNGSATWKFKVEGVDDAHAAVVKSVMEGILTKAQSAGGELCGCPG